MEHGDFGLVEVVNGLDVVPAMVVVVAVSGDEHVFM